MRESWLEAFYQETDANKRWELLKEYGEEGGLSEQEYRKKLWLARYGKRTG